jgi:hypothetical protein
MNICLVTPELPPAVQGGIGTYVLDLAQGFGALGHHVTVVGYQIHPEPTITHGWGRSISLGLDGRRALSMTSVLERFPSLDRAVRQTRSRRFLWRLARARANGRAATAAITAARAVRTFLRREGERFDIVELSNWLGHGAYAPPIRGRYVIRFSTPVCDTGIPGIGRLTVLERQSCRRAALIISHSHAMHRKGLELYGMAGKRAAVIYLGVPDVVADPLATPDPDRIDVIVIGRAEHRKGTDLLLRALPIVLAKDPRVRVTFVGAQIELYVGDDEPLSRIWRELLERFPGRIRAMGRISEAEKIRLIAQAHWSLVPSRFESFGIVAVEAMRAGTPVMAASSGGLSEVCAAVPTSRLFPPDDIDAIVGAFGHMSEQGPDGALALRSATRAGYEQHFRAERMVDQSLEAYQHVLAQ